MDKERFSHSAPVLASADTTISTDTTTYGEWIDTLGYGSLTVGLDVTITTDGQIDSIGWQGADEDDQSDAADLDDSLALYYPDAFPIATTGEQQIHVGTVAKSRYVRMAITTSEFSSGSIAIAAAVGLLQDSDTTPAVKESSVIADDDIVSPGDEGDTATTFPKREA